MATKTGFGILVEESVTVELEGGAELSSRNNLPRPINQKSCISCPSMLIMHLNQGLFQTGSAPAPTVGVSFEGETGDSDGVSRTGTDSGSLAVFLRVSSWSFVCLRG